GPGAEPSASRRSLVARPPASAGFPAVRSAPASFHEGFPIMFNYVLKKIVGTKNQRELRRMQPVVARINEREGWAKSLSDEQMREQIRAYRKEVAAAPEKQKSAVLDRLLPDCFGLTREASVRALGMRHFDVQLIGGMALHRGVIAEMKTGEGKTLVATLPCVLNSLEGKGVHVVTVNDYLARRDAEWMGRLYRALGLTTGCVVHGLTDRQRQHEYGCDITYGQNNEFGFDYRRDNMKFRLQDYVQIETLHHVEQALRAHTLYRKDHEYVVKDGEVIIVDDFTGRLMPGRRWSDGLHQAVEAKENVKIENENQTLATVSFQNYFRLYTKLCGMTGTADTEAEEFNKIYRLEVLVSATKKAGRRTDILLGGKPEFLAKREAGQEPTGEEIEGRLVQERVARAKESGDGRFAPVTAAEVEAALGKVHGEWKQRYDAALAR